MAFGQTNTPGASATLAKEAMALAQTAAGQAAAAQTAAQNAGSTANLALETANAANTTAGQANTKATEALGTANGMASIVQQAASDASAAADAARTAAGQAAAAQTAAQNAQQAADAALQQITEMASTIGAVPSQSGTLSYTGSAQSPTWNSYDPDTLTISGTTSGTTAGNYTATFTPKEGYKWADGTTTAKNVTWTIQKASLATPAQSGTLTYNGNSQTPSWSNYDSNKLTLSVTGKTDAGTYSASFTPKANYQWTDGTTTAKSVNWTIGKAAGSLSLNKSTLTLSDGSSLTGTVTVTRAGNGTISASSSNTNVATVSVSGTTVTVTGKVGGTATITVSVAAGTNHTAPANQTVAVTVAVTGAGTAATSGVTYTNGISGVTPEKLSSYAKAISNNSAITKNTSSVFIDDGSNHYKISVGDTITVNFGSEARVMKVMGFNIYDLTTPTAYGSTTATGKAGILLQTEDCLNTTYQMNSTNTNVNGWRGAALRTTLQGTIKNTLSSAWQNAIKSVKRTVGKGNNQNATEVVDDTLFLPTELEVFGTKTYCADGEGEQWPWYKANNTAANRVKKVNGSAYVWWECSPYASCANYFCNVDGTGNANGYSANTSRGVAPGFCV